MYRIVRDTIEAENTIWEGVPVIVSTVDHFRQMLQNLQELEQEHSVAIVGVRLAKDELREARIDLLIRLSGTLYVLGKNTGNTLMREQMKITPSHLKNCSREEYISLVDRIVTMALENGSALLDYGIQQAELDQLPIVRQELEVGILSTRAATMRKKVLTEELDNLSRAIDDVLKNELDPLVKTLKVAHPSFVSSYKAARMIINSGNKGTHPSAA